MTESKRIDVTDLQTATAALKLWGDTKRNAVIDWYVLSRLVSALTHPEAQGNKDLGEPQTSFAWQKIETAPKDVAVDLWVSHPDYKDGGYRSVNCHWDSGADEFVDGLGNYINGVKRNGQWTVRPTHWAPLPPPPSERSEAAPTSPQPIKGESELESASNGMGLR